MKVLNLNKLLTRSILVGIFAIPSIASANRLRQLWNEAKNGIESFTTPEAVKRGTKPGLAAVGPDGVVKYNAENIFEYMGKSLTRRAKEGDYNGLHCPDHLMNDIKMKLMSPTLKNVMMKAPAGVGKTTMAQCFARTIANLSQESAESFNKKLKDEYKNLIEEMSRTEREFAQGEIDRLRGEIRTLTNTKPSTPELLAKIQKAQAELTTQQNHLKIFETEEGTFQYLTAHSKDMIESWKKQEVMEFNFVDMMGGTSYRGQLEEKMKALRERLERDGNIIAFFDEAHLMAKGAGSTDG
jgi:ATP-dependent Clp protease ATP-binding subunit ClpA